MGMLKEFYTIREVSSLTGFTVQSVYNRLERAEKDLETARSINKSILNTIATLKSNVNININHNKEQDGE